MIRFHCVRSIAALGACLGVLFAPAMVVARQATPEPALSTAQTTAIVVSATNDPLRVAGSDGLEHLEFDLIVTNAFSSPVTLTAIDVTTLDGQSLLRLEGDALVTATQPILFLGGGMSEIPASGAVGVVVDVAIPPDRVPERLTHRIAYELPPDAPLASIIGSLTVDGPELPVDPRESVILTPPLRGTGWFGLGCCAATSLHRSIRLAANGAALLKTETFAIDWIRVRDGRVFEVDGTRNEQWHGYGEEVIAAAAGVVVSARDGMAEETPNQPPVHVKTPADYGGNHVTVEIAPGVFAFYAHLQPGSVAVSVGDQVAAGQRLGLLGNSGNSTSPHLHFGLIDAPAPLTARSLPMVFDRYALAGVPGDAELEALFDPEGSPLTFDEPPLPQEETLPLHLAIADFP